MKIKIILSIAIAMMSAQAKALPLDVCVSIESIADSIMQSRQNGQLLSFWYEFAAKQSDDLRPVIIALANRAYSLSEYRSDEYKRIQLIAFKNEVFSTCVQK